MEELVQHRKRYMKFPTFVKTRPKELFLKVLSLCLGVMLWYFVVGEDQVDMMVLIPIEVLNLPSDLVISNQFKKDIEVSVRGPRSKIQQLRNRNISRPINLSDAEPGTVVIKNESDSIPFPKGVTVLRLQPTHITLNLDQLITKNFPITPVTEGTPARGFFIQKISLEPDHLAVTGPKAILDGATALSTFTVNLDGLDHSTSLQVHLNLTPAFLDLIGESVVTAKLQVQETLLEKKVGLIPINVHGAELPVTIEPRQVSVTANIPENLVHDTPELAMLFRASVNASNVHLPSEVPVTVSGINVPGHPSIVILTTEPPAVQVIPQGSKPFSSAVPPKNTETKTQSGAP